MPRSSSRSYSGPWSHPIGRPQIYPNYGFLKQLHTFAACNCNPTPSDTAYRTWKRRQAQDVNRFLGIMSDTTAVIPDQLMMCRFVIMRLLVWSRPLQRYPLLVISPKIWNRPSGCSTIWALLMLFLLARLSCTSRKSLNPFLHAATSTSLTTTWTR